MARKRLISTFLLATAISFLIFAAAFHFSKSRTTQLFGEVFSRSETSKPIVALTFDDGPSLRFTAEVLALLKSKNVVATFFLTGKEVEENIAGAHSIVEAGHEIGNHSYSHSNMSLMGFRAVAEEVESTDTAIRMAGYQGEIHFRPPYGKKLVSLPWYLSKHNRKTVMWDVEPESYPDIAENADAITKHVLNNVRSGSVIIMHVMYRSRAPSREALPKIIDGLRERGFNFVTVSTLMGEQ